MSDRVVPCINAGHLSRATTSRHSSRPDTAARSEYARQLNVIAQELHNLPPEVEDALRARVRMFVALESPRTHRSDQSHSESCSMGSSPGVPVSKGVEKLRKYLRVKEKPAAEATETRGAYTLPNKAEENMQRFRDFCSRPQPKRPVESRKVFAVRLWEP